MTYTAASPIKLDTGDAIAVSNQLQDAARGGRRALGDVLARDVDHHRLAVVVEMAEAGHGASGARARRGIAAEQCGGRGGDVGLAHQRFADQEAVRADRGHAYQVGVGAPL